ncbi:hypothetical protein [Enterocloster lavalensis]|uniref:hypothetical protein n=1 Tax=Enterocloster lavalensis TaxID=460384 RepID=UPI001D7B2633|nr:hypothetical protein [Enterocloster lavalensis]MBS5606953.1 hypothetical protein [Enterocloster asparagiformis]
MKKKDEITELLQHLYGFSDEQLLQEFKAAEQEVKSEASPQPDPEGFKRLWAKLIKEHENGGPQ